MTDSSTAIKRNVEDIASLESSSKRLKSSEDIGGENDSDGIQEKDVGITHFLSSEIPGFTGQIKQRYTDFLVHEIDNDGNVVHLTDKGFKMPKKQQPATEKGSASQTDEEKQRQAFEVNTELRKELVGLLCEGDVEKIENVYRNAQRMESSKSFEEKSERAKIHQLLREAFNNELESVCTERNTFKVARRGRNSRVSREDLIEQSKDANGVENWGYGPTKGFLHMTLYKENKDTMDAVNILTKMLRMPTRVMRFAGTKDRRAVTCQRISISRVGVDRINALNRSLRGMVLGGFKFEDKSLNLGDLKGNEFVIVIRDVQLKNGSQDTLENILEKGTSSLRENGFVNYFGMQRFGTFSISTHSIGKELLLGNWRNAAELILSDQINVLPKSKEGRKVWADTTDPNLAMKIMPRQCVAENAILHCLSTQNKEEAGYSSNAYYNAIMKIPRNLRTMYVHAYQSFVWNYVASKRIEMYGLQLIEGDLVIVDNSNSSDAEEQVDPEDDFEEDLRDAQFVRARPLTKVDIDSGKYTMEDVVLPTPGFDIVYPSNENIKQLYKDIMEKDDMDPFNMRRKARDFSLAGSYRNIIQKPYELEYKITKYSSPTQQLVNTDFEILNNQLGKKNSQKYFKDKLERYVPDKGGDKTAVILKFQLGVSSYATMALRELMKIETSRRGDMCDVRH